MSGLVEVNINQSYLKEPLPSDLLFSGVIANQHGKYPGKYSSINHRVHFSRNLLNGASY
jgi:hypothetical protein